MVRSPFDFILLLGSAPAIDGVILADGTPFQLKSTHKTQNRLQPLGVLQGVTETWDAAKASKVKWHGIRVVVDTPDVPKQWIIERWTLPTDPRLDRKVFDGTIGSVVVFAKDGRLDLSMASASA
jgi:hypothetical protein